MRIRAALIVLPVLFILLGNQMSLGGPLPEIIGVIRCDTTNTTFGAQIIPAGDQDGDGYADLFVFDLRYIVFGFNGGTSLSFQPFVQIDSVSANGNCSPGDLDNDGYEDITLKGRGSQIAYLNGYLGGPDMDNIRDLWFCPTGSSVAGNATRMCSLLGDSKEQIAAKLAGFFSVGIFDVWPTTDSLPRVTIFAHNPLNPFTDLGFALVSGDFNADGHCDLVTTYLATGQLAVESEVVFYWGGPAFDTLPDFRFTEPGPAEPGHGEFGYLLVNLGDVNGDSYDDLWVGHGNSFSSQDYVYFCGPMLDSIPDITMVQDAENAANAGDINDDGYDDLMVSFPLESSSSAYVWLYYGGPTMDGTPDIQIYASDLPDYNTLLGLGIAGVGDVNGDGVDDFAASARGHAFRGMVYVFAGKGTVVSTPDPPTRTIRSFELYPNYPNPFNASTTIKFTLARRSDVRLTIVNTLGQVVDSPISSALSSGEHVLQWPEGKLTQSLSTGVYLVRLQAGTESRTQKMMLLK